MLSPEKIDIEAIIAAYLQQRFPALASRRLPLADVPSAFRKIDVARSAQPDMLQCSSAIVV